MKHGDLMSKKSLFNHKLSDLQVSMTPVFQTISSFKSSSLVSVVPTRLILKKVAFLTMCLWELCSIQEWHGAISSGKFGGQCFISVLFTQHIIIQSRSIQNLSTHGGLDSLWWWQFTCFWGSSLSMCWVWSTLVHLMSSTSMILQTTKTLLLPYFILKSLMTRCSHISKTGCSNIRGYALNWSSSLTSTIWKNSTLTSY